MSPARPAQAPAPATCPVAAAQTGRIACARRVLGRDIRHAAGVAVLQGSVSSVSFVVSRSCAEAAGTPQGACDRAGRADRVGFPVALFCGRPAPAWSEGPGGAALSETLRGLVLLVGGLVLGAAAGGARNLRRGEPGVCLTALPGLTFPIMPILGIPAVHQVTLFWQGLMP